MSKTVRQLVAMLAIGLTLRFLLGKAGWHSPQILGSRLLPAIGNCQNKRLMDMIQGFEALYPPI